MEMVADSGRLPTPVFSDRILAVGFNTSVGNALTEQRREELLRRIQERLAVVPGVVAAVPQHARDDLAEVTVHPRDRVGGVEYRERFRLQIQAAPPGYFALMGIPFVRGRDFVAADEAEASALVIRGDLARRLWGSADPIGRRLIPAGGGERGSTVFEVVGVVDENIAGLSGDDNKFVFVPSVRGTGSILIRTQGPAEPMIALIRSVAKTEAPELPLTSAMTLAAIEAGRRAEIRKISSFAVGAGLVALLLCAIGLYAVVAFAVGQRRREIGIRTALGANHRRVVGMFFVRGLRLSVVGLVIGLVPSLIVVRLIAGLEGENPRDGMAILAAVIAIVVVAVAALATWIPSRQAASVDPLEALRAE